MAKETALKSEKKEKFFYLDMLFMLILPTIMAWYYYGGRALRLVAVCVLTGIVCEAVGAFLMKCPRNLNDCSAIFIGVATALMMPADIGLWIPMCGVAFAILAVKLPLGGTFSVPFVPVAAGFAFVSMCWQDKIFSYPLVGHSAELVRGTSLASMLSVNNAIRPNMMNVFDILIGNIPGAIGASCILVLLGSFVFLLFRHPRSAINTLGFLAACSVAAIVFPRIYSDNSRITSLMMELCSGLLIFASIFIVTDPATSPKKRNYRLLYGAFTGVICMLLRYFGKFEESVCFAVLISNAVWPAIQRRLVRRDKKRKKAKKLESSEKKQGRAVNV